MKNKILTLSWIFTIYSCTPIKTSPKDQKHVMELTLQQVQTNVDDIRHELNCFNTDLQIIDDKINHQEKSMSEMQSIEISDMQKKLLALSNGFQKIEEKYLQKEKNQHKLEEDFKSFLSHANEITHSLVQYKEKIAQLEKEIIIQNKKFEDLVKFKQTLEDIANYLKLDNTYKVKQGDSLEKIAKSFNISVKALRKTNKLEDNKIIVGQELKIPK